MQDAHTLALAEEMDRLGIRVDVRYQGRETSSEGWEHHAFRFAIGIGAEENIISTAPYRSGTGNDPADVTSADVFAAVLSDINSVRGHDDWIDFAYELGYFEPAGPGAEMPERIRKARDDYREIKAYESLLEERIGTEELDALLAIAGEI